MSYQLHRHSIDYIYMWSQKRRHMLHSFNTYYTLYNNLPLNVYVFVSLPASKVWWYVNQHDCTSDSQTVPTV